MNARPRLVAYDLADAIVRMTGRVGEAERRHAYAYGRYLLQGDARNLAESERWVRTAGRRHKALRRLVYALRDLGGAR